MKKLKSLIIGLGVGFGFCLFGANHADAYTINNEFNLAPNEGSSQVANNKYILLHETANETATGRNEAQYMKRSWTSAYTSYIVGDGGIVYQVGQPGYVQYGAGSYANANSPVQIELQHTHDKATFEKNYKAYVELARDSAMKYGIPLTLDTPYNQPGIKSHLWVTQNIWGDHTDPYGYLSEMGVSKEKLAYDLAHGFDSSNNQATPSKPSTPSQHDKAVAANPAKHQGNAWGKIDYYNGYGKDQIRVAGWLVPDKSQGAIGKYAYVIFMEHGTGKELTRVQSQGIKRPDVKKAYGYQGGQELGFDVTVNKAQFKGKKVDVILRRANKSNGEGAVNDVRIDSIYLTL